jgi:hypothetical protein
MEDKKLEAADIVRVLGFNGVGKILRLHDVNGFDVPNPTTATILFYHKGENKGVIITVGLCLVYKSSSKDPGKMGIVTKYKTKKVKPPQKKIEKFPV